MYVNRDVKKRPIFVEETYICGTPNICQKRPIYVKETDMCDKNRPRKEPY